MLNNKVRLGDLIEVLTDYHANGAYKKLKENVELLDDEDYALMVRTTNFENNDFHDSVKYISEHAYNFLEKSKVYPNDLIMNKIANAGSIYLMPDLQRPVSLAMNLFLIRVNEKLANPVYVYLYLKINEQYVKQFANGSVTKTITKEAVRNLEIFLPSREEQDIVVEQYLALDNKINLNLKINQNLESIAQAVFNCWFIDFDPVRAKITAKREGKDTELAAMCVISGKSEAELEQMAEDDFAELQATAALFPDELVESELGEVPKGWEVTRFNKIILQYIDNRGKTPPTQIDGIPLLEVKHLPEGSLNPDLNTEKRVSLETFNNWFRAHLQEDDLIISTVGTIGRLCIIPADKKLTIAQNILGLRFKKDEVNPLFMYYQMDSCKFRNDVNARLVITVQASIKRKDLETIDLLKPDINIQNVFAEKIKPFVLSQQSDESLKLIDIRDTLLPKLLSGEVSVEDIKQQQDLA